MTDVLTVVLDTQQFSADPCLGGFALRQLSLMARAGLIILHIPWMVQREFQTQLDALSLQIPELARHQFADKFRRFHHDAATKARIEDLLKQAAKLGAEIQNERCKAFAEWLEQPNVVSGPFESEDARHAMDAYFVGGLPFRQSKSREDIPDALIFQELKRISTRSKTVHFVCGDENLRAAGAKCPGVTAHSNFKDFFGEWAKVHPVDEIEAANAAQIQGLLYRDASTQTESFLSALDAKTQGAKVRGVGAIERDASLDHLSVFPNFTLVLSDIDYLGGGLFGAVAEATGEALVDYYMEDSDWIVAVEEDNRYISIAETYDNLYWAQEYLECRVKVWIVIDVDDTEIDTKLLGLHALEKRIAAATANVESIEEIDLKVPQNSRVQKSIISDPPGVS